MSTPPRTLLLGEPTPLTRALAGELRRRRQVVRVLSPHPWYAPDDRPEHGPEHGPRDEPGDSREEISLGTALDPIHLALALREVDSVIAVDQPERPGRPTSTTPHQASPHHALVVARHLASLLDKRTHLVLVRQAHPMRSPPAAAWHTAEHALEHSALTVIRYPRLTTPEDRAHPHGLRLDQDEDPRGELALLDLTEATAEALAHSSAIGKAFTLRSDPHAAEPLWDWAFELLQPPPPDSKR